MKNGLLVFGLVGLLAASGWAMPTRTAPTTTAGGVFTKVTADPNHQPKISATAWLGATGFLGPAQASPSAAPLLGLVLTNAMNGTLQSSGLVTNPATMYTLCNGHITWPNVAISQTNAMWAGRLNPQAPFDRELGQRLILLIEAMSVHSADDISLDMITYTCASSDGGSLNDTYGFTGMNYSSLAIGVKSDGRMITSGSASQKCMRVIVFIFPPVYNGGDTQNGINQIADWINMNSPFSITNTVQVAGDDSSKSTAVVSTASAGTVLSPLLSLSASGNLANLNAQAGQTYQVYGTHNVATGPWQLAGIMMGTNPITVPMTGTMTFFKARVQ